MFMYEVVRVNIVEVYLLLCITFFDALFQFCLQLVENVAEAVQCLEIGVF